jgi:pimeloyl-ACP methyl ester carboxylesterase
MTISTYDMTLAGISLTVTEQGTGQPVLLLHGGGGPQTVAGFAALLAARQDARVITPVHPGFGGTMRPAALTTVGGLAALYDDLLTALDLRDVIVIGNSIGGWIAAELALRGSGRIAGQVLVDAVGIAVPGHPVLDIFPLTPVELSRLSFHDPAAFPVNPAAMTEGQQRIAAANRDALRVYGMPPSMTDPRLADRLRKVSVPTLVVWGESDQVVDPDYGRAFAAAIPGARFLLLPATGHLPQLETPEQLLQAVLDFTAARIAS